MTARHTLLAIASLSLLAFSGCGGAGRALGPAPATTEEAAIQAELARHPELTDEDVSALAAEVGMEGAGAAAVEPLSFWRRILEVERFHEFAFADTDSAGQPTRVVVVSHKLLRGSFHVATASDDPAREVEVLRKPLRDHLIRRVLLVRVDPAAGGRRPWRIAAVSGVRITSREASTRIESVRVASGDLDTTVTDPLAFWRLRRVLRFDPGAPVTLTVTTLRDDDEVILYARDRRLRFRNQGDRTYTATWPAALVQGIHHFGVNALSHGTLHDDQAPYDSQSWVLPYHTRAEELAELAP